MRRVETAHGEVVLLDLKPESAAGRPSLLFIHGSCAWMGQFEEQIAAFAKRGHRVVALDNLGCGRSDKPDKPNAYRPQQFVETAALVASRVFSHDEDVVVVGHSFGAYLALTLSQRLQKQQLRGSVLIGCAPFWQDPHIQKKVAFAKMSRPLLWAIRPLLGMQFQRLALAKAAPQALRAREAEHSSRNPVYMFKAFYQGWEDFPTLQHPGLPQHPLLFLSGEEDKITPPALTEQLVATVEHAVHRIISSAAHQSMQEQPEIVNQHIEEFLAKLAT